MRSPLRAFVAMPLVASALLALAALAEPAAAQAADTVPPVSAYLDSAAVVRALAALPAPEGPPRFTIFALLFDAAGAVDRVFALTDEHLTGLADAVTPLIRAHARRQAPSRFGAGIALQVVTGPGTEIGRPARMEWPELANVSHLRRLLHGIKASQREAVGSGARMTLRFRVLADGTVDPESVSVFSSTGHPELDRQTAEAARQFRFRPGMLDGARAGMWVLLPITLQPDR